MNKERLEQVLEILKKYENNSFTNYYELFDLDRNMNINELNSEIKKKRLQVLFHPDQINFIPNNYHDLYNEMIDIVKETINTFSNESAKENYDKNLNEQSFKDNYAYANTAADEDKTEDLTEVILAEAVFTNSQKYGFENTMNSLINLVRNNYYNGFTRENGTRDNIKNLERNKLLSVIYGSSLEENELNMEQIIMNYMTDLIYKTPEYRKQVESLDMAAVTTFRKYDMNGNYGHTKVAVDNYCITGKDSYFTNDNNVRQNLRNNVDYRNAEFFIKCSLNNKRMHSPDFSYTSIFMRDADYRRAYVNMIQRDLMNSYNYQNEDGFRR